MTYIINRSNGSPLTPVPDATSVTTYPVTLVGRDLVGYGGEVNSNFVWLLENFASPSAPANPLLGQLWFDSAVGKLKVCISETGVTKFREIPYINIVAPASPSTGELWFDTTTNKLKVYSGSVWIVVGPEDPDVFSTTVTNLSTNSVSTSVSFDWTVPASSMNSVKLEILARDSVTGSDVGTWTIDCGVYRVLAGIAALAGAPSVEVIGYAGAGSTWTPSVSVNASELRITVAGTNGANTINWRVVSKVTKLA